MRTTLLAVAVVFAAAATARADGPTKGNPDVKSVSALAFGPNGLLFVGDPQSATIFAIETGDTKPTGTQPLNIERADAKIAGAVGAMEKDIRINDVKVNPASGNVYVALTRGAGAGEPAIIRITRGASEIQPVALKDVTFSSVKIPNPGKSQREPLGAITSMSFVDGKLIVAGLSTEEFASTLRVIPFPFKDADKGAGIEIFHTSHNRVETASPVRTFVPYKVGAETNIMAAYTCTPLVKIPVSELKPGAKVKGTTIAELGSGNQPLDMIVYTKDGKDYLLVTNTSRGVMKVPTAEFGSAPPLTTAVKGTAGVKYETIAELKGVMQLDKLDNERAIILVKTDAGLDLKTIPLP
ncbi:MAG TPA: hypothetical protein VKE74_32035 [Gemmataceae bacterium]|nr:hypothetical protein [Gemmataceae bacterium]